MAQYVFTMHRLSKVVPPKREILKNISLSFGGVVDGVLALLLLGDAQLVEQLPEEQSEQQQHQRGQGALQCPAQGRAGHGIRCAWGQGRRDVGQAVILRFAGLARHAL